MKHTIIIRYGEIYLKGKNRSYFEKLLLKNIRNVIKPFNAILKNIGGRYIIADYDIQDEKSIMEKVGNVFGIVSISPAIQIETSKEKIEEFCSTIELNNKSFRVSVNRADKKFPINSTKYSAELGNIISNNNPNSLVKLKEFDVEVCVDIRENGLTYISFTKIETLGGMPVGCAGKGLLLLSGGIDSPVAGFQIGKRGMQLNALHFHSFPYTTLQAKEKVISLRDRLEEYLGKIRLYVCSFTEIQEAIHKYCKAEYMITIMRRIMMRIAEEVCNKNKLQAIITGESLGQVASQTIESITSTNSVLKNIPVLRPLIGMDKTEIIKISEKIKTYDMSILPYEDCCTVFLPKNPIIKPKLYNVIEEEKKLDIDNLIKNALNSLEIIN